MGIFGYFSAFKSMLSAGDNFRYIAQNVATIYYVIDNSKFGATITDRQKLYATALIDTYAYISNGTISLEDIARGVSASQAGMIILFPYSRQHGIFDIRDNCDLLNLTMQLEAMIFNADSNVHPNQIIDTIVSKKDSISDMINKTISQGTKCPLYKTVLKNTNAHLQDQDFQYIVSDLSGS